MADTGIAIAVTSVERTLLKKRRSTTIARTLPMNTLFLTMSIALRI
jgi:hypothetical protein